MFSPLLLRVLLIFQGQLCFFSDYLLTVQVDKLASLLKSSLLTASAVFICHVTLALQVVVVP